jgi:two-component sensor histidine kinase
VHLTEKDGLPDKEFYDILEDDNGIIWLAADKGIFSYNGSEFTSYTHPKQIGLSVFSLVKDNQNRIWFTNLANQVFYIENGEVNLYVNVKEYFNGSLVLLRIYNKKLIVFTIHKILIFDINSKKILFKKITQAGSYFNTFPLIKNDSVFFIDGKFKTTIIDANFNFKNKVNPKENNKKIGGFGFLKEFKTKYLVSFNKSDGNGMLHFTTDFKNKNTILKSNLPFGTRVYSLEFINDLYFYATNNGLFICKVVEDTIEIEQHLFPEVQVSKVINDSQNNLWVTTLKDGVFVIPNLKLKQVFETNSFNSINKMYKGKPDELFIIAKKDEVYKYAALSKKLATIPFNNVTNIKYFFYNPKDDNYFIKLSNNILGSYQLKNNEFLLEKKHIIEVIKSHFFVDDNELLLATNIRLSKILIPNKSKVDFKFEEPLRSYDCYYNSTTKQSYFATVNGLFVYDDAYKKSEITFNNNPIYVKKMVAINDKELWCMSFKNGLYHIKDNQVVKHYTTRDGLLSNTNSFIKAYKNSIWITSDFGIQNFNTALNQFKNLRKKEGIPAYNFTGLEVIEDNVFISTQNQLFSFNANTIFNEAKKKSFEPYFTSVLIDDKIQPLQQQYKLANKANKVTINYNTNGFLSKGNTTYQYRLIDVNNADVKWQTNTSNNNQIVYNGLLEGSYTFQLKTTEAEKETKIKEIKFNVAGVFYEQWWFYVCITLGVMTLFLMYFTKQKNRFKEKQNLILEKQKKELENVFLKLESLRSQMNPHFVFNALNSIQDYIINNQKNLAADYLGKFADLIRKYLDQSAKKQISLSEEIETLNTYLELEKLRFEEKLNYKIIVQENLLVDDIFIPTVLIQPYAENALKHGLLHKKTAGSLSIEFNINDSKDYLIILIKDDGVGRKKSKEIKENQLRRHKSFATEATANRLELLNYNKDKKIEIFVEDLDVNLTDVGTKVTIKIPI